MDNKQNLEFIKEVPINKKKNEKDIKHHVFVELVIREIHIKTKKCYRTSLRLATIRKVDNALCSQTCGQEPHTQHSGRGQTDACVLLRIQHVIPKSVSQRNSHCKGLVKGYLLYCICGTGELEAA